MGFIPQPALSENSEDYVDYTRIPFDVNSAENKIRTKKMSVSGTVLSMSPAPTSRKASTGNQQVIAAHLPSVAAAADPVEKTAAASAIYDDTTTGPAIAVEGHKNDRSDIDGVNLQTYINQMTTEGEPGVDLGTGQGVRPANEAYQHQHQEAPRPTSSTNRVPFPRIGSAAGSVGAGSNGGSRPASSTAGGGGGGGGFGSSNRNDARTPTLADHAARLQLTTPLPPPQPLYVAEQQSHKAHNTAGVLSSAGLKNLLQKNIEASAMAVYQLQEQQQQIKGKARGQGDAGLTDSNALVVTASCASAAHPPTRLRPSSTKARSTRQQQQQQQSPRQQHKAKDIDWSNPNYVPSGAIGSATMPAGSIDSSLASVASSQANHTWTSDSSQPALQQRGTSSRGQISQDGNFDVYAAFQSGKSAFNDSAVVRLASPTHTAAGGNALGSPIGGVNASNKFSDMVVSGRKRSAEASREKVTNAVLFM